MPCKGLEATSAAAAGGGGGVVVSDLRGGFADACWEEDDMDEVEDVVERR